MKYELTMDMLAPHWRVHKENNYDMWRRYVECKYAVSFLVRPRLIVEIGICSGQGAHAMMSASPEATYVGFDAWLDAESQANRDWAYKILSSTGRGFVMHTMNTQAVDSLPVSGADLFHVDGAHLAHEVEHDLGLAWKAVRNGGYILVDDVAYLPTVKEGFESWMRKRGRLEMVFLQTVRGDVLIRKCS